MIGSQFVWAYSLMGQADKQQPEKVYSGATVQVFCKRRENLSLGPSGETLH